jgi:zinc/manganese transport system permease protein
MGLALLAAVGYQPQWWEVLGASFMRHALIGGTLVALIAGVVGYFVTVRSSAFAAHALAHIGFPGATGAALVGAPVTLGLLVFCLGGAMAIGVLGRRVAEREVATGTVLAFAMALGVLFASLATRSIGGVTNVLFGNLLAITTVQLWVFAGFAAVILVSMVVIARPLLFASIDAEVAEGRGLPVRGLGVAFLVLLALTVTMAIQVVGTLLLFALVVTPAATAIRWTPRPVLAVAGATGISLAAVWVGLVLAVMFNLPPSFLIVSIAVVAWLLTWVAVRPGRFSGGRAAAGADGDHPPDSVPVTA